MKNVALIVAAGSGVRFDGNSGGGDIPKQFQIVAGKPLLTWTIEKFEAAEIIDHIIIVAGENYLLHVNNKIVNPYEFKKVLKVIPGGDSRAESVLKGLEALPQSSSFVAIHDGVRPLVKTADIERVFEVAHKQRAAVLGRPVNDTLKRVRADYIMATVERDGMFRAETPQVFQYDLILEAYRKGMELGLNATDDAFMVESLGFKVQMVAATGPNTKVTRPEDMELVRFYLEGKK